MNVFILCLNARYIHSFYIRVWIIFSFQLKPQGFNANWNKGLWSKSTCYLVQFAHLIWKDVHLFNTFEAFDIDLNDSQISQCFTCVLSMCATSSNIICRLQCRHWVHDHCILLPVLQHFVLSLKIPVSEHVTANVYDPWIAC